ncbi:hypothetical protein H6G00_09955 [Leptolyngbya sp. FACHB-541]|uniref:hypothetical protein n=1 Tax=Leptolyngbya sp. FACHB-541 TaxID=2692810 RepID=UPI0016860A53|nr:hypothetical protein [Leptolyngbya sp. FACHB-541]MBD1996941.1 hypothetical protein [Leptolyngbya sp. FACHB-541]
MKNSEFKNKVLQEIEHIPENRLVELYDVIHTFRLQAELGSSEPGSIMKFAGCWSDLPNEIYTEFLDDISLRRQQAFSRRRNRETNSS